jgi:hypothetical protein
MTITLNGSDLTVTQVLRGGHLEAADAGGLTCREPRRKHDPVHEQPRSVLIGELRG